MKNIVNSQKCLKCKACCFFENKDDAGLAPFFSEREIEKIGDNEKFLDKKRNDFYQAKVVRAKNKRGYFCVFLNQRSHKCRIYKNRPLDCETWPFIVGWDKNKKGIFLWIVDKKYCPYAGKEGSRKYNASEIVKFLKKKGFFKEVSENKRYIWPYKDYQIKLKKIIKNNQNVYFGDSGIIVL